LPECNIATLPPLSINCFKFVYIGVQSIYPSDIRMM
ncbi:MAG: hypothetical protein ACI9N1_002895, partial [Flavobacteriales bacterium]